MASCSVLQSSYKVEKSFRWKLLTYQGHSINKHDGRGQHVKERVLGRAVVPRERVVVVVEAFHADEPYSDILSRVQRSEISQGFGQDPIFMKLRVQT